MTDPYFGCVSYRVRLARVTRVGGGGVDRVRHALLTAELERDFTRAGLGPRVTVLRPAALQADAAPADLAACVLVTFADGDTAAEHVNVLEASGFVADYWLARVARPAGMTGAVARWEDETTLFTVDAEPDAVDDEPEPFCGTPGPYRVGGDGFDVYADPRHGSSEHKESCHVASCHRGPDAPTAEQARHNAALFAAAPARDALAEIRRLLSRDRYAAAAPGSEAEELRERLRKIHAAADDALSSCG